MTHEISATPVGTWHILSAQGVCEALSTDPSRGLPSSEAAARLARYGENRLTETHPRPIWLKLLDQAKPDRDPHALRALHRVLVYAAAFALALSLSVMCRLYLGAMEGSR